MPQRDYRKIVIDLGLVAGEVCGDWDHERASVRDESGAKIGFVELNDGRKLVVWIKPAASDGERYVVSDERLEEIRAMLNEDHPAADVGTLQLAGAVYDLLAERDAAPDAAELLTELAAAFDQAEENWRTLAKEDRAEGGVSSMSGEEGIPSHVLSTSRALSFNYAAQRVRAAIIYATLATPAEIRQMVETIKSGGSLSAPTLDDPLNALYCAVVRYVNELGPGDVPVEWEAVREAMSDEGETR